MGVDYDARFGVGFNIIRFPEFDENKYGDEESFLDEILRGTPYRYIQWGDGCYGGEDSFAVVLSVVPKHDSSDEAFLLLRSQLIDLYNFLIAQAFEVNGDTWLAGGLRIW